MHGPINVKSPNNISKWQMGFNSAFKGLIKMRNYLEMNTFSLIISFLYTKYSHSQAASKFTYFGASEKLLKGTTEFVMSVCLSFCCPSVCVRVHPSVRMEQLRCHWTDFHEISYLKIFRKKKPVNKIKVAFRSDKNNGTWRMWSDKNNGTWRMWSDKNNGTWRMWSLLIIFRPVLLRTSKCFKLKL